MKIYDEITSLHEHTPWGGAGYNYNLIIESNNDDEFIFFLEDMFPEGLTSTELNDILWFEDALCYQFIDDELLNKEEKEIKKSYWED